MKVVIRVFVSIFNEGHVLYIAHLYLAGVIKFDLGAIINEEVNWVDLKSIHVLKQEGIADLELVLNLKFVRAAAFFRAIVLFVELIQIIDQDFLRQAIVEQEMLIVR